MKQAGENSNSLKMVFRNRPENEKIVRTTAAVFASVLDPTLEEISDFKRLFQRQSLMRLSMPIQKQEAILRRILKEKIKR